jgi:hypothetical protein
MQAPLSSAIVRAEEDDMGKTKEWIAAQDWTREEEPSPVQVALRQITADR